MSHLSQPQGARNQGSCLLPSLPVPAAVSPRPKPGDFAPLGLQDLLLCPNQRVFLLSAGRDPGKQPGFAGSWARGRRDHRRSQVWGAGWGSQCGAAMWVCSWTTQGMTWHQHQGVPASSSHSGHCVNTVTALCPLSPLQQHSVGTQGAGGSGDSDIPPDTLLAGEWGQVLRGFPSSAVSSSPPGPNRAHVLGHSILQLVLFKSNGRDQGSKCQDSRIVPWEMLLGGLLQRCKGQFGTRTLPSGSGSPFFTIEAHPTPVPGCPGKPLHCTHR